jgi:hypothetical protein
VPYKSRKNRRSVSPERVAASTTSGGAANIQSVTNGNQSARSSTSSYGSVKIPAPSVPVKTLFISELKWITLVTVIMVILILVAYYIFR